MACNDSKNPLQHEGTSQQQRQAIALQAGYVLADERGFAEWIVFAGRFSAYLNYYNEANIISNTWQPFFENDLAAVLGSVAIQNIDEYRRAVKERLDYLRDDQNEQDEAGLKATLGSLFSAMLTLSIALDGYLFRIPKEHILYQSLQQIINQKLQPALKKLLAYYKGGKSRHRPDGTEDAALVIIADKDFPDWIMLGRPVYDVKQQISTETLSPAWLSGKETLRELFHSIPADASVYGDEAAGPYRRIQHAANHNLFVSVFDQFLSSYARIIQSAESALLQALTSYNTHPPHYTLFLTFLQLYRFAQDELNTITQRHLDFYYQQVLRLSPKSALPNSAYLTLELAKGVNDFSLPQGTLFKAGKDNAGKEVAYALDKETVFNKARVARLMSVYGGERGGINGLMPADDIAPVNNGGRLFAAPVANSADGLGAALATAQKEWHPFVHKTFVDGNLVSIDMPKAHIGLALASSYLALAEGDREIHVKLSLAPFSDPLPATIHLDAYLTTAKEWLKVTATTSVETLATGLKDALVVKIILEGDAPAITSYNRQVHGGTFRHAFPVLKLLLSNEDAQPYEYDQLKNLQLTDVALDVFVGMDGAGNAASKTGIRQLQLANEFGGIDPAKPFQPFGLSPRKGSSFIVGSEELFKKPGASFLLRLKWLDLPAKATTADYEAAGDAEGDLAPKVSVDVLAKGAWRTVVAGAELLSERSGVSYAKGKRRTIKTNTFYDEHDFPGNLTSLSAVDGAYLKYEEPYSPYTVKSQAGFLRLLLEAGFGYDDYQQALTKYLVGLATTSSPGNSPVAPYVPKLESISLHYKACVSEGITAATEAAFEQRQIEFYHLYPFGEAEQHQYLTPSAALMLLPQFAHGTGEEDRQDSGELYIGLTDLQELQAVNLLFGVMEGTADPLTIKPANHINWSYLSNNQWKPFASQEVGDGTAQLIQTGIISLAIPEDATTANTLLPGGYLWIRASVNRATMAVCKLIGVDAQAAVVTFSDNGNAQDFLDQPLPAAAISKLKTPLASVKKITQPYASFGGRPVEAPAHYYTRVSERLRHKDRAITIWDYEHLILEAFPQLHRVKCLSHTSCEQLSNGTKRYNEAAPGHVTILTIPSLVNLNTVNPLRPYTNEATLAAIDAFVRQRISCHIVPHVVHPVFEEVAMDFLLRLMPGYDDYTFYIKKLKEEITEFLTPWAFGLSQEVAFGGKASKSVLINFIEERPYVDYITNVKMYHRTEAAPNSITDVDEITASTGRSILVSVPAAMHAIEKIPDPVAASAAPACVDAYNEADQKI